MAAILTTFALISGTVKRSAIYLLQPTNRRIDVVIEASGAFYIVDSHKLVSVWSVRESNSELAPAAPCFESARAIIAV